MAGTRIFVAVDKVSYRPGEMAKVTIQLYDAENGDGIGGQNVAVYVAGFYKTSVITGAAGFAVASFTVPIPRDYNPTMQKSVDVTAIFGGSRNFDFSNTSTFIIVAGAPIPRQVSTAFIALGAVSIGAVAAVIAFKK